MYNPESFRVSVTFILKTLAISFLKLNERVTATIALFSSNGSAFRSNPRADPLICHSFLNISVPVVTKYSYARTTHLKYMILIFRLETIQLLHLQF